MRVVALASDTVREECLVERAVRRRDKLASGFSCRDPNDVALDAVANSASKINAIDTASRYFSMCDAIFAKIARCMTTKWAKVFREF